MSTSNETFNAALKAFMESVDADVKEDAAKNFSNLTWSDDPNDPDAYFFPLEIGGGRKYVKLVSRSGTSRSVYCFVEVSNGRILMAASWKAPSKLDRGANIWEPASYEDKNKACTRWLYR